MDIVFALVGIHWVFQEIVKEALINSRGSLLGKKEKDLEVSFIEHILDSLEGEEL